MLTVTMLIDWGPPEYVWLKKGQEVSLPRNFAITLIKKRQAKFTGSAIEMYGLQ